MKFLFDFFPILLFFIAYKLYGIYVATAVAIGASFVQVGWFWFRHHRVETMHLVTLGLIVLLGGATLYLHNETFIKWKPTIVDWVFGGLFLATQLLRGRPLVERMMGANLTLPAPVWQRLNLSWGLFFIATGAANLYVVYNFDTDIWVDFKLFGMMGLTVAFVIVQAFYLARYIEEPEAEKES